MYKKTVYALVHTKHKCGTASPMRMKGDEGWIFAIQPLKPR